MSARRSPRLRCEAVGSADFGYGPVEELTCNAPATHRGWVSPMPEWGFTERERVIVCDWHARPEFWEGGGRFYRFRRVS